MSIRIDLSETYLFSDFTFNPKTRTINYQGQEHQLRKKQNDVLLVLCRKSPEPVSHKEFLDLVWKGCYVTPQSIAQVIHSLRRIIEDNDKSVIVTLPKLGYRLCADVLSKFEEDTVSELLLQPIGHEIKVVNSSNTEEIIQFPLTNPGERKKHAFHLLKTNKNAMIISFFFLVCCLMFAFPFTSIYEISDYNNHHL